MADKSMRHSAGIQCSAYGECGRKVVNLHSTNSCLGIKEKLIQSGNIEFREPGSIKFRNLFREFHIGCYIGKRRCVVVDC